MPLSRRDFVGGAVMGAAAANSIATPVAASSRFSIERFVENVKAAQRAGGQQAVEEVLARALSDRPSVLAVLGEPAAVGPMPIYHAPDLTILNVVWAPLMVLLPHDHKMWATIGIYTGREDNILWKRKGDVVEAESAASLSEREVWSLPADAIHSVTNPIPRRTGAIHIYGGDFFAAQRSEWDAETLRERPMDPADLQRRFDEANERFRGSQQ